nr:hypothetical protein [Escherichia coli]
MKPDYGFTCLNGFLVPADILSSVVLPGEIMALALTEKDRNIPIIGTLNTLFLSSATVGECPLFRFRAALGKLQKAGWRTYMSAHGLRGCSMNPLNGPVPGNVICYN